MHYIWKLSGLEAATMCEKHIFSDPASSHKGVISTKRKPQTGIATFQFIPRSQCKNNLISERVHSIAFHKGHASLKSFFLQSRACLMGWSGDRERGVATSHFWVSQGQRKNKSDREKLFLPMLGLTPAIPTTQAKTALGSQPRENRKAKFSGGKGPVVQ